MTNCRRTKRRNGLGWLGDKSLRRQIVGTFRRFGVLSHVVFLRFVMHPAREHRCVLDVYSRPKPPVREEMVHRHRRFARWIHLANTPVLPCAAL